MNENHKNRVTKTVHESACMKEGGSSDERCAKKQGYGQSHWDLTNILFFIVNKMKENNVQTVI